MQVEYQLSLDVKMSCKVIVLFAFLAVAFAEKPHLGLRLPHFDLTQVVGGSEAPPNAYPFIASLQYGSSKESTSHFCASSILNERWLVTAGHCTQAVPGSAVFVAKAGKHNINIVESTEQMAEIEKAFVHEKYGGGVGPYDISLLKLKTPLKLTKEVQPIGLPKAGSEPSGNPILCGWGSTSSGIFPIYPDKLQHVKLEYVERQECHDAIERLTGSSPVHETNVCSGPMSGGISACSGDSGGPLFEQTSEGWVLTGIVSWGIIPCGTTGAPSVYCKPSVFIDWIQDIMAKN